MIRNAGEAFGDFQTILSDFNAAELYYTILDFHNTRKRYETLITDAEADVCGRVAEVKEELDWLLSVQDLACKLTDMHDAGELPLRVTHNDTKINNVLFHEETGDALVVIDLDTVMPGLVGHDFGDAIRFAANFTEEDAEDTSKTGLNLNVFWAFAEGFLSQTAKTLTEAEVDTLALSCFAITCELATRFLDDYINGDKYFKTRYDGHNLVRARCQIALAKDMLNKMGYAVVFFVLIFRAACNPYSHRGRTAVFSFIKKHSQTVLIDFNLHQTPPFRKVCTSDRDLIR